MQSMYKMQTKNKIIAGIVIIMSISLATLMPTLPKASALMAYQVLSTASVSHGFVGPTTTIKLGITYQGITFTVSVTVSGADAYYAVAGALVEIIYEDYHGRYVLFAAPYNVAMRSWVGGAGGWDRYDISYISGYLPDPTIDMSTCASTGYARIYTSGIFRFRITYSTWWGALSSTWDEYPTLYLSALVPCSILQSMSYQMSYK